MITYKEVLDRVNNLTLDECDDYLMWLFKHCGKRFYDKRLCNFKHFKMHECMLFMKNVIELKNDNIHYDVVDTFTKVGNFTVYHGTYELELFNHKEYYTGTIMIKPLRLLAERGYHLSVNAKTEYNKNK